MEIVSSIISLVQLAISAAPSVEAAVTAAKNTIAALFKAGVITKDVQDSTHAYIDAYAAAVVAGTTPPEFTVEPDPS